MMPMNIQMAAHIIENVYSTQVFFVFFVALLLVFMVICF